MFPPMFFLREIEGPAVFVAAISLLGLAFVYAVLYLRDSRNEVHDPEIGLKAALYFMFSLSILLMLSGLTILIVDFLKDDKNAPSGKPLADFNEAQRTAFAWMVSGFAIGLFHLVMILGFTNDRRFPATRRVFVGWRLAIHSVVVLVTFTTLVTQVFQRDVHWDDLKQVFGILLVWGPSWLIHLLLMRMYGSAPPVARLRPPSLRRDAEED